MAGAWYGPDGRTVTAADAGRLLADWPGRVVAEDLLPSGQTMVLVVTSFTVAPVRPAPGAQHDAPILWETMVTAEDIGALVARYRSRDEAEFGHARVVAHVRRLLETFHPAQAMNVLARVPPQ